jgi:hypothetical protein
MSWWQLAPLAWATASVAGAALLARVAHLTKKHERQHSMSRRTHRAEPRINHGDIDPMTIAARRARVPRCDFEGCSRAAGHTEGDSKTKHVIADRHGTALQILDA